MGFGIAVLSSAGQLLAMGRGTPPHWVHDAAGAELWAYQVAVRESPGLPRTVSDCKNIRDCLALPKQRLLGAQAHLGRTWAMILQTIDSDLAGAHALMTWMPSHTSAARMMASPPVTSAGLPVTWLDWRANRLVDLLAKSAAAQHRLPASVFQWLRGAEQLQRHQAAVLGLVTHAATHFEIQSVDADGNVCRGTIRDSWGERPRNQRTWRRYAPRQDRQRLSAPSTSSPATSSTIPWRPCLLAPREKRRRLGELQALRDEVRDARQVADHLAATCLQPSSGPSADERLAALRERIRARAAEGASWDEERRKASRPG